MIWARLFYDLSAFGAGVWGAVAKRIRYFARGSHLPKIGVSPTASKLWATIIS